MLPTIYFCTDQYAESERFDVWQEEIGRKLINFETIRIPGDESPFFHRLSCFAGLGDVKFTCLDGSSVLALRQGHHLSDGDENFVFRVLCNGTMHLTHRSAIGGHAATKLSLSGFGGVLASNGRASEGAYLRAERGFGRLFNFSIPREVLLQSVPDADARLMQGVAEDSPILRTLARYASDFINGTLPPEEVQAERMGNYFFDLICMLLGPSRDAGALASKRSLRTAKLHNIKKFAEACFLSGNCTVSGVATYLGTTERYVQQILEEEGTTFTQIVLDLRLAAAFNKLSQPHALLAPISTVARDCGFNDVSYFNRTFKRKFEETPRECRNRLVVTRS